MRKKNGLVIILTLLIFLSSAVLGVSTVYRVNAVSVRASVVSEEAKAEADALQELLRQAYDKESIFSVNDEKAKSIVENFPYFRITAFEREYPNRLVVAISEDAEVYAVPVSDSDKHYILNESGTILGIREEVANRSDNADNLLILGINATGEKGENLLADLDVDFLFSFLSKTSEMLGGIRRNVARVEVIRKAAAVEETVFKFSMREGVNIYIRNPYENAQEKRERAVNAYMAMSSEQRLKGMLLVSDVDGAVIHAYSAVDTLS